MDLPPSDSSGDTPLPPYSLGDPLAASTTVASTEALRSVLARHRRRQLQVLGGVLALALFAGSLAGFAIGRQGRAGVTRLAAGSQPTDSAAGSSGSGVSAAGVSSATAPSAAMLTGKGAVQSNQLLVRNAKDGTRVRLYEETFPMPMPPQPPCKGNKACPEIAVGNAMPSKTLLAEVSDDQVAGQAGTAQGEGLKTAGFDPLAAEVVGAGQPQPILVVFAHAAAGVTTVDVTTPYGSDSAAPGPGGWVALAVRLPADYVSEKLPSDPSVLIGIPSGTVTAKSASGAAVDSITLGKLATKMFTPCDNAMAAAKAAANAGANSASGGTTAAGQPAANSASGGTTAAGKPASAGGGTTGSAAGSSGGGTTGSAAGSSAAGSNSNSGSATASAPPTLFCGGSVSGGSTFSGSGGSASSGSGSSGSGSSSSASVPAPGAPASPAAP